MIDDELLDFINCNNEGDFFDLSEIEEDEFDNIKLNALAVIQFQDELHYVRLLQSYREDIYYVSSATEDEYMSYMSEYRIALMRRLARIQGFNTEPLNVNQLIEKAEKEIEASKAVYDENMKLPEEDLVSSDEFSKMMGL